MKQSTINNNTHKIKPTQQQRKKENNTAQHTQKHKTTIYIDITT